VIHKLRFQTSLLLLAIMATLLMMLAPVVSRALQSAAAAGAAPLHQHQHDHTAMPAGMDMAESPHAGHVGSAANAHSSVAAAGKSPPITDEHAAHGEACDYCTMASRLLPWLALLLVLAPLRYRLAAIATPQPRALPAIRWPAHAARGPPLYL
jgi:hypothetical protein